MQEFADNCLLPQVILHNLLDARDGEVAVADGPRPNGQVGAVVAAPLAATGPYVAGVSEAGMGNGVDEGGAEYFTATKWPMTEVYTKLMCGHVMQYSTVMWGAHGCLSIDMAVILMLRLGI